MKLSKQITDYYDKINKYLHCGYVNWDSLIERIKKQEKEPNQDFADEQIWTFLIACGYACAGQDGLNKLCELLTGDTTLSTDKIWIEVLPLSPRHKEGSTHLDLAIGDVQLRKGTESGIELATKNNSWIAFCEMKWYSDISYSVSHDQHRNQLIRVIENALLFEKNKNFADKIYVNLITPEIFKNVDNKSRLYYYKFDEYKNPNNILKDIKNCKLDYRKTNFEKQITKQLDTLNIRWIMFDLLFKSLPDSEISRDILEFERKYNSAKFNKKTT